jgi:hypothetical protein
MICHVHGIGKTPKNDPPPEGASEPCYTPMTRKWEGEVYHPHPTPSRIT